MYFYESSWNKFASNTKYREQKELETTQDICLNKQMAKIKIIL